MDFSYYDFRKRIKSQNIEVLFPGWEAGKEKVVVFSPHDDDAILGAGYLLQSVVVNGGEPFVLIFCNGNAGYSNPEEREVIVEKRKEETKAAYAILGLSDENV
ncbi:PIG-L deacetylase family protein [Moorella sp. ACPs]|uniref:PIG-L deacetylase family protein n=1 Tax=Neomoorella carbonis TaxID=3062783 RepID=UPI0032543912